jgi:hypothetical protein
MEQHGLKKMFVFGLLALSLALSGCAAVAHRNLETESKLTQALFLDEECLSEGKPIYVKVRNQSDVRELEFERKLIQELQAKGFTVTRNAKDANHELNVVFVVLEKEKEGMTAEGALAGGFGGTLVGGAGSKALNGTSVGGGVGALAGAALGSMVSVDRWFGVVDVQIKERVKGAAKKSTTTGSASADAMVTGAGMKGRAVGSASVRGQQSKTEYQEQTNKVDYYTRIVVTATKTNLDKVEAATAISSSLAYQVANFF